MKPITPAQASAKKVESMPPEVIEAFNELIAERKERSMNIDADKLLENAIRDGIREAIKTKFGASYSNPLDGVVTEAIKQQAPLLRQLLSEAIQACMSDDAFRKQVTDAIREKLAKTLVQRFGGELEKQVNQLKSDPATRARITLAIEGIVGGQSPATA